MLRAGEVKCMWETIREALPQILSALIMMFATGLVLIFITPGGVDKHIVAGKAKAEDWRAVFRKHGIIAWVSMMATFVISQVILAFVL